ncbi:MAG: hypothetical protein M1814_002981 [Vezdaea aestivalis]|nr:MAG: hypothetical protein M1814_002981 [Vezdaea aestivalis]
MAVGDAVITMPSQPTDEKPIKSATRLSLAISEASTSSDSMRRTNPLDSAPRDEEDAFKRLGKIYQTIKNLSPVTKYLLYAIPVAVLIAIPLAISVTVASNVRIGKTRLMGLFVWLEAIWCGIWVAKLLVKMLYSFFRLCCGVVNPGARNHAEIITKLKHPISFFLWVVICYVSIPLISAFNDNSNRQSSAKWIDVMQKIFLAGIPASSVLLVEKLFIQLITLSYHRKQFEAKIAESKRMVSILENLYGHSIRQFPVGCPRFEKRDLIIQNVPILSTSLFNTATATKLPSFTNFFKRSETRTAVVHDIVTQALEDKKASKALAERLWLSIAKEGKDAFHLENLQDILGSNRHEEADKIFNSFDKNRNGDISLDEMIMMVEEIRRGNKSREDSLYQINMAISCLDHILLIIVLVFVALIYAAFFSKDFLKNLTVLTTSILSVSFAFAGTVQEFTGSCIFLFVKHPYDVYDRVDINGTQFRVERIELLYTVFYRIDSNKTVQVSNIVNNTTWIENVTRSKAMKERIPISIHPATTNEDLDELRRLLSEFVHHPDNRREYKSQIELDINAVGDMKQLELYVEVNYKSNWSNESLHMKRRAKFMLALVDALRKVPIYAPGGGEAILGDQSKPTYAVTISEDEAQRGRDKFKEDKEAKRMVNVRKTESSGRDGETEGVRYRG